MRTFVLCWSREKNKARKSWGWDKEKTLKHRADLKDVCCDFMCNKTLPQTKGKRAQWLLLLQRGCLHQTRVEGYTPNSFQPWASVILIRIRVALFLSSNPSMGSKPNQKRQINLTSPLSPGKLVFQGFSLFSNWSHLPHGCVLHAVLIAPLVGRMIGETNEFIFM